MSSNKERMEEYITFLTSGDERMKMKPAAVEALSLVALDLMKTMLETAAKDAQMDDKDEVTVRNVDNVLMTLFKY
uniref:Centromere protein X n=1 Tax=Panagrolaimus sp. JU765 TaxID=591449 RepID=A0AC34R0B8_9BILA